MVRPLTDAAIRKFVPPPGPAPRYIPDGTVPGMRLAIYPTGIKSFQMRFRGHGKITLGPYDPSATELTEEPQLEHIGAPLSLAAARLLGQKVIRERKRGANPIADARVRKRRQRAERKGRAELDPTEAKHSFAAAVRLYVDQHARKEIRRWQWTARLLGLNYATADGRDADDNKPQVIAGGLL